MSAPSKSYRRFGLVNLIATTLAACQVAPPGEEAPIPVEVDVEVVEAVLAPEPESASPVPPESPETPVISDLWQRLRGGFQLGEHYHHPDVTQQLQRYASDQRFFDLISTRAAPFLVDIIDELERRQLPLELALLPAVESTYNATARSAENAVGLWQFISPTARSFGLQQDWWYDARRDPVASTAAALDYLQLLNAQFAGDWLLTLAAYNTGDGNVRRALARQRARDKPDFWSLTLAAETRNHVPRLLALARLVQEPALYGIELPPLANERTLATVDIRAQIDFIKAAELAGLDYAELRAFNPGYLRWALHPDSPQTLRLPPEHALTLESALAGMDRNQLLSWDHYQIEPGDTLLAIAGKLGTRVDILQRANGLSGTLIVAGQSLLVPRGEPVSMQQLTPPPLRSNPDILAPRFYTVRRGDNLWGIARRYQLRSRDIARWNQMDLNDVLRPGRRLQLRAPSLQASSAAAIGNRGGGAAAKDEAEANARTYRVRRGDSMAKIARAFDAELQDLLEWNQLTLNQLIFPGQELWVQPPVRQ